MKEEKDNINYYEYDVDLPKSKKNSFNNFEQRNYNMDELESILLNTDVK